MQVQSSCFSGEGRTITEVADVVTLWTNLRADIQVNLDAISKRTKLEVVGCGTSITNRKEYFSIFTVSSTRRGTHYLIKTNYKTKPLDNHLLNSQNDRRDLEVYNTHTYNIASYTYQNQKLELYIESYNDVQGLIRGCITLAAPMKRSFHL